MQKTVITAAVLLVCGAVAWVAFLAYAEPPATSEPTGSNTPTTESWECNADAMICPDGSAVGRTGPNCEFAACPAPTATSATLTTFLGGNATGLNITVSPRELVSDSRCPQDVQCIWAGTVEVRAAVSTQVAHGEHVFTLGEPRTFGDYMVTLTDVTPAPKAGEEVPESSYRFIFKVERN